MSALRRLMGLGFRTDPRRVAASIALSLVGGFALPMQALGVRLAVSGLQNGHLGIVVSAALLLGLGTAFVAAANVGNALVASVLQQRVGHVLDRQLIDLVGAPQGIEHFERADVADELALVRSQRDVLASPIAPVFQTLSVAVGMAASLYLLFHIHPLLLLIPVCGLPALAGGVRAEVLHQSDLKRDASTQRRADTLINLAVSRESAKELRTYNLGDFVLSGFLESQDVLLASERRSIRRQMPPILLGALLTALGYAASILFVAHLTNVGRATAGDVYVTVFLSMAVLGQTVQLLLAVSSLVQLVSLARRLQWLTDAVTSAVPLPSADSVPTRIDAAIELRDVSFRYPGTDRAVLSNVSLVLPAGSTVALVGENGAGKTTLVKLLARLYQPDEGQILLDGRSLTDIDLTGWRASITAGFQDFCRFEFSAQHAVAVGDLAAIEDQQAVRHALHRAGAGDLVDDLPMGLTTQLGRSFATGVDLSGGQWQKVALARALMRQTPLLMLLDEPTASLDAATESSLFDRFADASLQLRETTGGITVLVSHRFTTVRMADLIVVLEAGQIRESGTHDELMTSGGRYAELFTMQSHSYVL